MISEKKGVQQLIQYFKAWGIQHIVFSPGSRNAPLVVSFANDPFFQNYVVPDERSAAFFGLGIAEQVKAPVALICTSGSAVLNYAPAISEAYYRQIPLVVVSADRPTEWIDQGDGQTIRQNGTLSNFIGLAIELLENPIAKDKLWYNECQLNEVGFQLSQPEKKPIHINFPFTEPLYGQQAIENLPRIRKAHFRPTSEVLDLGDLRHLQEKWQQAKKKMIICGQMPKNGPLNQLLSDLSKDASVAVLIENTSNLSHTNFIACIDRTLNSISEDQIEHYTPDLLITIGGAVVSKRIKAFLRKQDIAEHWKIGHEFQTMDTYQALTESIAISPLSFFRQFLNDFKLNPNSRFGARWKQLDFLVQDAHRAAFASLPYSDLTVFEALLDYVPENSVLHMGNSSVVRYCQLFEPISTVRYYSNRGTSGIDGSSSAAVGASVGDPNHLHTLISGDISFFYDSNAFWNKHLQNNIRIVVINNGGGGIFKIIPGPNSTSQLADYFVAEQNLNAAGICSTFNINYYAAKNLQELDAIMPSFYTFQDNERPALLEIFTQEVNNEDVLQAYFQKIKVVNAPLLLEE
jgi:2-succinyl-5-enolpyruvyl-6-hydroxy-3-cyclohexene-1-carboxylate synthase